MTASSKTVIVAIEHHFVEVGGEVYTAMNFGYEYWQEYLEVFDEVIVLGRVGKADAVPEGHFISGGPCVRFIHAPDYLGPRQFVKQLPGVMWAALKAARSCDRFILRTGNICTSLWLWLMLLGKPYAREVQGHTAEAIRQFGAKMPPVKRITNEIIAEVSEALTATQLRHAHCASYVSKFCQKLYPTGKSEREFIFSSVKLTDELITAPRSVECFRHTPTRFVCVGRLEAEKGHHVLVEAARILRDRGVSGWTLKIIGPGRHYGALCERVAKYHLQGLVVMHGPAQYGPELFGFLDEGDVFVIPSLTEGMPRALIEAMGRGLPAIGTRTGGVSELLEDTQLVPPNRAGELADAMAVRIGCHVRLAEESHRNNAVAICRYNPRRMRQAKHAFWQQVRSGSA